MFFFISLIKKVDDKLTYINPKTARVPIPHKLERKAASRLWVIVPNYPLPITGIRVPL
jgi:hypothetical protein